MCEESANDKDLLEGYTKEELIEKIHNLETEYQILMDTYHRDLDGYREQVIRLSDKLDSAYKAIVS